MRKQYVIRLTEEERKQCEEIVDKRNGSVQKVKRANILLTADVDGPGWSDQRIAEAFRCRHPTVENVRKRCVVEGFNQALEHQPPVNRKPKVLNGAQESKIIAMRLGEPPQGYGRWTLRLRARKAVELDVVEAVSHETIRRPLKKTV